MTNISFLPASPLNSITAILVIDNGVLLLIFPFNNCRPNLSSLLNRYNGHYFNPLNPSNGSISVKNLINSGEYFLYIHISAKQEYNALKGKNKFISNHALENYSPSKRNGIFYTF